MVDLYWFFLSATLLYASKYYFIEGFWKRIHQMTRSKLLSARIDVATRAFNGFVDLIDLFADKSGEANRTLRCFESNGVAAAGEAVELRSFYQDTGQVSRVGFVGTFFWDVGGSVTAKVATIHKV